MKKLLFIFPLLLLGCSGLEKSETQKVRKANAVQEPIYRLSSERYAKMDKGAPVVRQRYPWETAIVGNFPLVTKEFFRCKGSMSHPDRDKVRDCGGIDQHSLPLRNNEEFVYPALLEILNYVQASLKKRVVVTCGHRCPVHNTYADPSRAAKSSKHMVGAEVDFYVEGTQFAPYDVIKAIMEYYHTNERTRDLLPYTHFSQMKQSGWMNREVVIRLYDQDKGRDFDNQHEYPYISIELRHDFERKRPIHFNWNDAHQALLKR